MRQLSVLASGQPAPWRLWHNPLTPHHSLRVTKEGKDWIVRACGLPIFHFEIQSLNNRQLLQLDRLFESPYFLRNRKTIEMFGEQDAIMLQLHGNNLTGYLDDLDR
jgi:hypothetical protein